jgi:hypothetical protein
VGEELRGTPTPCRLPRRRRRSRPKVTHHLERGPVVCASRTAPPGPPRVHERENTRQHRANRPQLQTIVCRDFISARARTAPRFTRRSTTHNREGRWFESTRSYGTKLLLAWGWKQLASEEVSPPGRLPGLKPPRTGPGARRSLLAEPLIHRRRAGCSRSPPRRDHHQSRGPRSRRRRPSPR